MTARATVDVVLSRLYKPIILRFCVRCQSVASLKTNTGTRSSVEPPRPRPTYQPHHCERTDVACHFAPTPITAVRYTAHLIQEPEINIRGKHTSFIIWREGVSTSKTCAVAAGNRAGATRLVHTQSAPRHARLAFGSRIACRTFRDNLGGRDYPCYMIPSNGDWTNGCGSVRPYLPRLWGWKQTTNIHKHAGPSLIFTLFSTRLYARCRHE